MKRVVAVAILLLVVSSVAFAQFARGNQTVTVPGYVADITVVVTFDARRMTRIVVRDHKETPVFANPVWEKMIPAMIDKQTWDVDIVAGSTVTANALKEAVKQAMAAARR